MRTLVFSIIFLATGVTASAQNDIPPTAVPAVRERISLGALATPALEGAGPWFMPAVRLSLPLGSRHGVDLDGGRIYGGSNKYADIRTFYAAQIRFLRGARLADGSARYWLAGLKYLAITKLDGAGSVVKKKADVPATFGHGWSQVFRNGARVANEIGFSGGNGFMFYASVGVQWGRPMAR
jgi:hypothetical protein